MSEKTNAIKTIGELAEALVKHIETHPDCSDDPIAVHNIQSGLSHPITDVSGGSLNDAEDPGLFLFIDDSYDQVDESLRSIPDKYNIGHRINLLFDQLAEEFKKPGNEKLMFTVLPGSNPPQVVFRRKDH